MSAAKRDLQVALWQYTTNTLADISTVKGFCEGMSSWKDNREKELNKLKVIKNKVDLSYGHITQSEKKCQSLREYMKRQEYADEMCKEKTKELDDVLKVTLGGLEKLDHFLEAVEKLAVTSLHVFIKNQVLHLPKGIRLEHVQVVIMAARLICPLLLAFKRDARVFFLTKLQNVEVLSEQLDKYIKTTCKIFEGLKKSCIGHPFQLMDNTPLIKLNVGLSEAEIQEMLRDINQLNATRMDQNFRLVFLFRDVSCSGFIDKFKLRQPRMLKFLTELEKVADRLHRMNKGAKISSVAGSSVSAVGGVLSIVGLALIPATAGVSMGLTIGGVVLGMTSALNTAVTTAAEIGVNRKQKKKANEDIQSFMKDMQILQCCLEDVRSQPASNITLEAECGNLLNTDQAAELAEYKMYTLVENVSAIKFSNTGNLNMNAHEVAIEPIVPEIGLNALFLGMDIFAICRDGYSLAKGSETEVSNFLRARAALWRSEMVSWKKIHDSLCEGQKTSEKHRAVLDKTFYPESAMKKKSVCVVQ